MHGRMQAAVCQDRERITLEEVPIPQPQAGQVLVKVHATGLCGSDVDGFTGDHPMIDWPIILGHECAGEIAELGPGVTDWKPGDAVAVEPFSNCRACPPCRQGRYNLCRDLKIIGHQISGSLADYVVADADFLHRIPRALSYAEAALAEPVSGALHAVERCSIRLGQFVVVIGCGTIGCLAMQHALNKGAEVLVSEPVAFKRTAAAKLGAHHVLDPETESLADKVQELSGGLGADCVIEAVGKPETLAQTIELTRRGGEIMLIGWSGQKQDPFDLTTLTLNELTVRGTLGFCHDYHTALNLMAWGRVTVKPLMTHTMPLQQVEQAIDMLRQHADGVWKIIISGERS